MVVFSDYASYYELLYADKDYTGEAQFVHRLIQRQAPGAKDLLELGCGTARHAQLLLDRGYSILGVDQSAAMVERLGARIAELPAEDAQRLEVEVADIRTLRTERRFDAAYSLFHVMSYLPTDDDIRAALRTARVHLEEGGAFVFDFWHGPAVLADPPVVRVKRAGDDTIEVTRIAEPDHRPEENRVDVHYHVFVRDKVSDAISEVRESHRMRYLFVDEITRLLQLEGFSAVTFGSWMSADPPNEESYAAYCVAAAV